MWKSGVLALFAAAVFSPSFAQADTFDQGMNTMWEVLWHQSGTATRLVRWNKDIKVRVFGVNAAAHRARSLQALRTASAETGVKVIDVTDQPDAAQQANLSIEIVPNEALAENQPCETRLDIPTETTIRAVTMQMRDSDAYRCTYHETMHVFGVRGHPEGDTVLNYFTTKINGFTPLDKAMLRAWYSPKAQPGMTPFEFLPVLADQLMGLMPDKELAKRERDIFLTRTVQDMQAFADGMGDAPKIIQECGKETAAGVKFGRMEMSYFLGVAYDKGASVPQDTMQATQWLQRAADMGSRSARTLLAQGGATALGSGR
jgi:hypothetical protein